MIYIIITASYQDPRDYIFWDQRRLLVWKDFKVKYQLPKEEKAAAEVTWTFITPAFRRDNKSDIQIHAAANKNSSWVKNGSQNEEMLDHEQGHFDLVEINCRKFRKGITEFTFKESTYNHDFDSLWHYYFNICNKQENEYDAATNHGINKKEQQNWLGYINDELEQTKLYGNPNVTVTLH